VTTLATVTLIYHLASRLAYVIGVGWAMHRQDRSGYFTRRYGGGEAGFRAFRRRASLIMNNDGLSFIALCVVSMGTLSLGIPAAWRVAVGAVLILIGVLTKLWARATLGADAYYWRNFFTDSPAPAVVRSGPYRFLANPMYTVGYLQTYGLAFVTGSLPGLIAAAFDQSAILGFHRLVERPHFERYRASIRRPDRSGAPPPRVPRLDPGR